MLPTLLWPLKIRIAPNPADLQVYDEELREPVQTEEELEEEARRRSVVVPAQVVHNAFEQSDMKFTGDDEATQSRAVILRRHQKRHNFKAHQRIIEIIEKDGTVYQVNYKITEVRPKALQGKFGLFFLYFEDIAKA